MTDEQRSPTDVPGAADPWQAPPPGAWQAPPPGAWQVSPGSRPAGTAPVGDAWSPPTPFGTPPGPQSRQGEPAHRQTSRLPLIAGIVLPVVVLGIGAIGYLGQADRAPGTAVPETGPIRVDQLQVGHCFDDDGPATADVIAFTDVTAVRCDEPHDNEVFHTFELVEQTLPSNEEILRRVDGECLEAFDAFVGKRYELSDLDFFPIWPSPLTWNRGGRTVSCSLYASDLTKLVGSARGSAR